MTSPEVIKTLESYESTQHFLLGLLRGRAASGENNTRFIDVIWTEAQKESFNFDQGLQSQLLD